MVLPFLPARWNLTRVVGALLAIAVGDAGWVRGRGSVSQLLIDRAFTDPAGVARYLAAAHGLGTTSVKILRTDLVNDTTTVEVAAAVRTGRCFMR